MYLLLLFIYFGTDTQYAHFRGNPLSSHKTMKNVRDYCLLVLVEFLSLVQCLEDCQVIRIRGRTNT